MLQHEIMLEKEEFEALRDGSKTIHIDVYDEKFRKISNNDTLLFKQEDEEYAILSAKVTGLEIFDSFEELLKSVDMDKTSYDADSKIKEIREDHSESKEDSHGVVAIEFELLN